MPYIIAGGGDEYDQNGQDGVTDECGTGMKLSESGGCDGNGGQDLDYSNGCSCRRWL